MFGNDDETSLDRTECGFDGRETLQRVGRLNVPGAKIDDADRQLACIHGEQAEVAIVSDDSPTRRDSVG